MESLQGKSALVTGAGSGIGKALVLHFAQQGCSVTASDRDAASLAALQAQLQNMGARGQCIVCDVTSTQQQEAMVARHMTAYGSLDIAVLNAGIGESGDIFLDEDPERWKLTYKVDLESVLIGARIAVRAMLAAGCKGSVLCVASAAGVFAMPHGPVYAAAKAGVYNFARSAGLKLAPLGVRVNALCPEFVDTPLLTNRMQGRFDAKKDVVKRGLQLLTTEHVVKATDSLVRDPSKSGVALLLRQDGQIQEWGSFGPKKEAAPKLAATPAAIVPAVRAWACEGGMPTHANKIQVVRLSAEYEEATRFIRAPLPAEVPAGCVLVRRAYAGINASDINYTSGRYHSSKRAAEAALPFDSGFEAVGAVAAVGAGAGFEVGQPVASISGGGFADYAVLPAKHCLPVPSMAPEVVALLTSGLTASIALEQAGRMRPGETVLVTAAAGGTGQFAVQLAALAGCEVIATCSSEEKAALLRRLGAKRVINYKTESFKQVLKSEYPRGVDLIYESVGGGMFDVAVNALARHGRLIVIGMMSQYKEGWPLATYPGLAEKLLWKSATVVGFFLMHFVKHYPRHLAQLAALVASGKLHVAMDPRRFVGLESVPAAVAHLQSGASIGKVFVQIPGQAPPVRGAYTSRL